MDETEIAQKKVCWWFFLRLRTLLNSFVQAQNTMCIHDNVAY